MRKSLVILIIIVITSLGGYLRFINLGSNPSGLNVDEISIGYDAYSILKTGKDTSGLFMPISFPSLGDYKPPLYIYLTSIVIALFGLSEYSVRFTSAFFGTLAIPLIYLLANKIFKNYKIGIFSAFFLAISPWHIFYSRIVSESQVAMVLVMFGLFSLIKFKENSMFWGYLSIFFLVASMYTYHSERLFLPIFLLVWAFSNKNWLLMNRARVTSLIIPGIILSIPLGLDILFGKGGIRASQQTIYNDLDFIRQVLVSPVNYYVQFESFYSLFDQKNFLAAFFVIRKFLSFLQTDFLFFNSLPMLSTNSYGLGVMYIFQAPILIAGIVKSFSLKSGNKYLIPIWFFVGLIPGAITLAEHHTIRTLVVIPVLAMISGVGLLAFFQRFLKIKNILLKSSIALFSLLIISINILQAFLMFTVHLPMQQSDTYMVGNREAVVWISEHENYKEIIFDPRRLSNGQIIISVPYLYYLFHTKYDPKTFQNQLQDGFVNSLKINNVIFREVAWTTDYNRKDVVFIGDPFFIIESNFNQKQILKKIYSRDKKLILIIIDPFKPD